MIDPILPFAAGFEPDATGRPPEPSAAPATRRTRDESRPAGAEAATPERLARIVDDLNRRFAADTRIHFRIEAEGHELSVQIVDRESDEVIRSIPSDRLLELRRHLRELAGLLLDDTA